MKLTSAWLRLTLIIIALLLGQGKTFAYDFSANGLFYNINTLTGTVEVTYADNSYNSYSGYMTIPAEVTYGSRSYEVTAVGDNAFRDCNNLTGVTLGDNIATIGKRAFMNCSSLVDFYINEAATQIGDYAFAQCTALQEVTFNNINPLEMGNGAFLRCSQLTDVSWPSAEKLDCQAGLSRVGTNAFAHCSSLEYILLPGDIQLMGSSIFDGCQNLRDITLTREQPLALMGDPFALNPQDITISVPSSGIEGQTATLYENAIGWRDYNIVELPYSFIDNKLYTYIKTSAGNVALTGCCNPTKQSIVVRNTIIDSGGNTYYVSSIADEAFKGKSIGTLDTSNAKKLKTIGTEAFATCTQLTGVTLCEGISTMGNRAFAGCTSLTTVQVPSTLRVIPTGAFEDCSSLSNVNLVMGVATISTDAFARCVSLKTIDLPRSTISIEPNAFNNTTSLKAINVDPQCTHYASFDGVLFECKYGEGVEANEIGKMHKLLLYPMCKPDDSFYIPCGVVMIDHNALLGASHLKNLTIPATTTIFGDGCFNGTAIESINYRSTDPSNDNTDGLTANFKANVTLQVPIGTTSTYTALEAWSGFKNMVEIKYAFDDYKFSYDWNKNNEATIVYIHSAAINNGTITIPNTVTISGYSYYVTELKNTSTQNAAQSTTKLVINADSLSVIDTSNNINPISALKNLQSVTVSSTCRYFKAENGMLLNKLGTELYCYLPTNTQQFFTLPNGVETIMPHAFSSNKYLTHLTFNTAAKQVRGRAFEGCTSLQLVDNAKNIKSIDNRAFAECSALSTFQGGEHLNQIGDSAFINCSNLIHFPFAHGMVKSIGDRAFKRCSSLMAAIMNTNLNSLGIEAFKYCSSLNRVFFLSELEHLGYTVFGGCNNLNEMWISNVTAPYVDNGFFAQPEFNSAKLFVPEGSTDSYSNKYPWNTAASIVPSVYINTGPDVNGDKVINALDITLIMSVMLGDSEGDIIGQYDVNHDGTVNSTDITIVYDYILNGAGVNMVYKFVKEDNSSIGSSIKLGSSLKVVAFNQALAQYVNTGVSGFIDNPNVVTLTQGTNSNGVPYLQITPVATGYFTLVAIVNDGTTSHYRTFPMLVTQ